MNPLCFIITFCVSTAVAELLLSATKNENATISVHLQWNSTQERAVTGYKIFFAPFKETAVKWNSIEFLTTKTELNYELYPLTYPSIKAFIKGAYPIVINATVFLNQSPGPSSNVFILHPEEKITDLFLQIENIVIQENNSLLLEFVTNIKTIEAVSVFYKENTSETFSEVDWTLLDQNAITEQRIQFELPANKTYEIELRVRNATSNSVLLYVPAIPRGPTIHLKEGDTLSLDPDSMSTLSVTCTAHDPAPSNITWLVNDDPIPPNHTFYSVFTILGETDGTSTITAKARTRSDKLTCLAIGPNGGIGRGTTNVDIRGPGSPPSMITLKADRDGWYQVEWRPPIHPNGNILAYVLYHTGNKDLPLSDWHKIDLESKSFIAKVNSEGHDVFVRLQAVSTSGAGLISPLVASQKNQMSPPLSVKLHWEGSSLILEPNQTYSVECRARGRPAPVLQYALGNTPSDFDLKSEDWTTIQTTEDGEYLSAHIPLNILTSKTLYCRAQGATGSNISTISFIVQKPGDAPIIEAANSSELVDFLLTWKAPNYPNLALTKYEIIMYDNPDASENEWKVFESNIESFAIPILDLPKSTTYYMKVRAVNAAGRGPFSNIFVFESPNGGPEKSPTNITVYMNEANIIVLSWGMPNTTLPITGFMVFYTRDPSNFNENTAEWSSVELDAGVRSCMLDFQAGLKPKTVYRAKVAAKNDIATGPSSKVVEFETAHSELPVPTDVHVQLDTDNSATVSFNAVRDPQDHSKIVEEYRIDLSRTDDVLSAKWIPLQTSLQRKIVDLLKMKVSLIINGTAFQKNATYWIRVRAVTHSAQPLRGTSKPKLFITGDGSKLGRVIRF